MNLDRVPSRSEVMGWSPQQLADYLKTTDLFGCDKVVLKNSISGSRFVNLSEFDLQKFPKLHTPMISKISSEISKKEKRGPFGKKTTPKYHEPEIPAENQGWGDDEFDDEEFDDDYESPYSGDDDGSGGDYESPNEDLDPGNDYEPPPSVPLEEHKLCPTRPLADGEYIDNRNNQAPPRGPPPVLNPRPTSSTHLSPRQPAESKRDPSPHNVGPSAGKFPPLPPQIFRSNKPGRASGPIPTPSGGLHRGSGERPSAQSLKPPVSTPDRSIRSKAPVLPPPSSAVSRSNSSARPPPNRFDGRREQTHDEGQKHNTFPLHNKSVSPRPGLPGPPRRHGDGLPPSIPSGGSLPHKLHPAMHESRGSVLDRSSFRPRPPTSANNKELDPRWYVGKVSRGQAEGCLIRVQKDGAYLVRDSTRQLASQPFTLMVLYQDKVYNIQIRQQNQQFLLGTGLKVQEKTSWKKNHKALEDWTWQQLVPGPPVQATGSPETTLAPPSP